MAVDQNILDQYPNKPDLSSEINNAIIGNTTPQGYQESNQIDPYTAQVLADQERLRAPQEIGPQGMAALYPGLKHNINVGGYSGSIVGSQNVYVPGGNIMALDPVLARRKAIDDAARARATQIKPFDYDVYKLQDARYQQQYEDVVRNKIGSYIEEAQKIGGKDFGTILSDAGTPLGRKFKQELSNLETFGKEFDQLTNLAVDMRENLISGEKSYTPEAVKILEEYEGMLNSFGDSGVWGTKDLNKMYQQLKGYTNLENYIQDENFFADIQAKVNEYGYVNDAGDFFKYGTTKKTTYEQPVRDVAKSLAQNVFKNDIRLGYLTEDDIYKAIKARFPDKVESDVSISQKTAATLGQQTEEIIAGIETANTYRDDAPGVASVFKYDEKGNRVYKVKRDSKGNPMVDGSGKPIYETDANGNKIPETIRRDAIMDVQVKLSDKKKDITERKEDGTFQKSSTNGIKISNLPVANEKGYKHQPGNSFFEVNEFTKLKDGSIVAKGRAAIPTTSKGKKGEFDSYTQEDVLVVLFDKDGNGTGAYTEIKNHVASKNPESAKKLDQTVEGMKNFRKQKLDEYGLPISE